MDENQGRECARRAESTEDWRLPTTDGMVDHNKQRELAPSAHSTLMKGSFPPTCVPEERRPHKHAACAVLGRFLET